MTLVATRVQDNNYSGTAVTERETGLDAVVLDRPIRLILPKKGRLTQIFEPVMNRTGWKVTQQDPRHDFGRIEGQTRTENAGMDVPEALYMRGTDALRTLAAGVADMAIIGRDVMAEFNEAASEGQRITQPQFRVTGLGLAPCGIYIAVPENKRDQYREARDLDGCRVATSFPGILQQWAGAQGINLHIVPCEGGVEDSVRLGLADIVCDIVETGKSLAANGLVPVQQIMQSEALLVTRAQGMEGAQERQLRSMEQIMLRAAQEERLDREARKAGLGAGLKVAPR
jgi:ATP phosphoribosyltransferase